MCSINAHAIVRDGTPIDTHCAGSDEVEVTFGSTSATMLTVLFDSKSLLTLAQRASDALAELNETRGETRAELAGAGNGSA